jgi:hypothetical protein
MTLNMSRKYLLIIEKMKRLMKVVTMISENNNFMKLKESSLNKTLLRIIIG